MQIHELTALARQMKASDIHISQGLPLMFRIDGKLVEAPVQFDEDATRALIENTLDESHREALDTQRLDADFAIAAPDGTRSLQEKVGQVEKFSVMYPKVELRDEAWRAVLAACPDVEATSSLGSNIELNAPGVTKGSGLLALAEKLGLRRDPYPGFVPG